MVLAIVHKPDHRARVVERLQRRRDLGLTCMGALREVRRDLRSVECEDHIVVGSEFARVDQLGDLVVEAIDGAMVALS